MKLVSDTGPLIGLAKIGQIYLLKNLAEEVIIPPMVHKELFGKVGTESIQIENALHDFIHIENEIPLDTATEKILAELDEGEKQAIALASISEGDVLLLLDDRAGSPTQRLLLIIQNSKFISFSFQALLLLYHSEYIDFCCLVEIS